MEETFHLLNLTHRNSLSYLKRRKEKTLTQIEFIARLLIVSYHFRILVKVGMPNNVENQ